MRPYERLGSPLQIQAGSHSFKKEVADLNRWYQQELKELSVDVRTRTEATVGMVKVLGADVVILSMGYMPVRPKVSGIENPMAADLMGSGAVVYEITGRNIGTIMRAIWSGYELGNNT